MAYDFVFVMRLREIWQVLQQKFRKAVDTAHGAQIPVPYSAMSERKPQDFLRMLKIFSIVIAE